MLILTFFDLSTVKCQVKKIIFGDDAGHICVFGQPPAESTNFSTCKTKLNLNTCIISHYWDANTRFSHPKS